MATPQNARDPAPHPSLIAGLYAVNFGSRLADAGGGLDSFAVADRNGTSLHLMAVRARDHAPPRGAALATLLAGQIDHVLTPIAHGAAVGPDGTSGYFVICPVPSGPPIWPNGAASIPPWNERNLLDDLLRPAAAALTRLADRNTTHRAIRPNNVFRHQPGEPATLGMAWAGPPAALQSAVFEPPYVAVCPPSSRGDGSLADDVYALGVTMLTLALGRMPMAGLDEATIIGRKLDIGSYAALLGDGRLPPLIADLVSGMLAEDPEHRPHPAALIDPSSARGRRVSARPARRAQRPLDTGTAQAWTLRGLADIMGRDPDTAARLLRVGVIDTWMRRNLGDPGLAARLDEVTREHIRREATGDGTTDSLLVARAIALIDPLAPLWWCGQALWPDGLGPTLAQADRPGGNPAQVQTLRALIQCEGVTVWAAMRTDRAEAGPANFSRGNLRGILKQRGWGGGMTALRYSLNPLLPCASPVLAGQTVVRITDLLAALESAAGRAELRRLAPFDAEIAGFLVGRGELTLLPDLAALAQEDDPAQIGALQLRIFAGLQTRLYAPQLPQLAAWLAEAATPVIGVWRSRTRRSRAAVAFQDLRQTGNLSAMLRLVDDPTSLALDANEAQAAIHDIAAIDQELSALEHGGPDRARFARQIGYEFTNALALTAVTASIVVAAIG